MTASSSSSWRCTTVPNPGAGFTAPLTRTGDARTLASRDPRLEESVNGLRSRLPHLSAATSLSRGQRRGLLTIAGLLLTAMVADPATTVLVLVTVAVAVYLLAIGYRLQLMRQGVDLRNADRQVRVELVGETYSPRLDGQTKLR